MFLRFFGALTAATLVALPSGQADPIDDLRWYNNQQVTMMELALRDVSLWMANQLDVDHAHYGEALAYMDEPDGPIVLSLSVFIGEDYAELCDFHLHHMKDNLFFTLDRMMAEYADLFVSYSGAIDLYPDSFEQSMAELTVLEILDPLEGSCRMPLLGGEVAFYPSE